MGVMSGKSPRLAPHVKLSAQRCKYISKRGLDVSPAEPDLMDTRDVRWQFDAVFYKRYGAVEPQAALEQAQLMNNVLARLNAVAFKMVLTRKDEAGERCVTEQLLQDVADLVPGPCPNLVGDDPVAVEILEVVLEIPPGCVPAVPDEDRHRLRLRLRFYGQRLSKPAGLAMPL